MVSNRMSKERHLPRRIPAAHERAEPYYHSYFRRRVQRGPVILSNSLWAAHDRLAPLAIPVNSVPDAVADAVSPSHTEPAR